MLAVFVIYYKGNPCCEYFEAISLRNGGSKFTMLFLCRKLRTNTKKKPERLESSREITPPGELGHRRSNSPPKIEQD